MGHYYFMQIFMHNAFIQLKKKKKDKFNPAAAHFACCYMKLLNVIYFLRCLVVTSLLIDACVETP